MHNDTFRHYIEDARRAIFSARYEAAHLGSSEIVPEHILLGLLRNDPNLASGVIDGVSAKVIRHEILAYLPRHEKQPPPAELPLSQDSQRVLAAAREEADRLARGYVSSYHILFGLMCVEDGFAAQVLRRNGLSTDYLRERMSTSSEESASLAAYAANDVSVVDGSLDELERRVIELFRLNDYQGALKLVDDAIADPGLDRNRIMWSVVPIASVIARAKGDLVLMKRYCELRVNCDPDNAMALYALADCLALQGEADQARSVARKSYELSLSRSGAQNEGLAELIEGRFPGLERD